MVRSASESAHYGAAAGTRRVAVFVLCVLCVLPGCHRKSNQLAAPSGQGSSVANSVQLAPLAASAWLVDLDVPGFGSAKVAVPLGAREPRPIVLALHGSADRPEWACGAWRGIAGPTPFVLCPRGVPRPDFKAPDLRFTYGTTDATAAELRAALAALKHEFGAHVAPGSIVIGGFEIGADRAAAIAEQEPTFFARIALVDPGSATWPSSQAALFGREGGERVLFACGPGGRGALDFKAALTRRGGADAKAVVVGEPPALNAAAVSQLQTAWVWLSAPVTRLAPPEHLAGNPLTAERPVAPRIGAKPAPPKP